MILHLVSFYRRLPIKPFSGILKRLYQKYKLFNKDRVVVAIRDGIKYKLDLNELIDSAIYYNGCFEPMTTEIINKYTKEGMIIFDIGVNIGCHTLRFARLVEKTGKVIAFKPMSWAFLKLKNNVDLNNFDNILLEKIALLNINQGKKRDLF